MNKHAYRVIFNQQRRQWMAVAETVSGRGKAGGGPSCGTSGACPLPSLRLMPFAQLAYLSVAIAALFGGVTMVQAQIVADPNAGRQRPTIDQSANGRPVVQIVPPNAAGLSHNKYRQFNVDRPGAILNNSGSAVQTRQGGVIGGNPNLVPGRSARIILNEVTGTGRSRLNGYTEVAGQRAQVIIANPNGISCNGCGFINTTRGVLTTGRPVFGGDGSLAAFRVTRGDIAVGGLNGGNVDQLDLIARSVQVNDELWANQLNVISGANRVDYTALGVEVIDGEGARPTVSIDVAQLGGMYANKIRLIGTEAGVGVASLGNIATRAGDMEIDSQGNITLKGKTSASGRLAIRSGADVSNSGTLSGQQAVQIDSGGRIANSGTLSAVGDLTLSGSDVNNDGTLSGGQAVHIDSAGRIVNRGMLAAVGDLALSGSDVHNDGTLSGGQAVQITSAGRIANRGTLAAIGDLTLSDIDIDNDGTLSGRQAVQITSAGRIANHGKLAAIGDLALSGSDVNNDGTLSGRQAVHIDSTGRIDNRGTLTAVGDLTLSGSSIHSEGTLAAGVDANADNQDHPTQPGNLTLIAANGIDATGRNTASGDLSMRAATLNLRQAITQAAGAVTLNTAGQLDNRQGHIQSGGALRINAAEVNNSGGRIAAVGTEGLILHTSGRLINAADLPADGVNASDPGGVISSTADLSIQAATLVGEGQLIAGTDATIALQGDYTQTAGNRIIVNRDLNFSTTGQLTNAGELKAMRNLHVNANQLVNQHTGVINAATTILHAADAVHNTGRIYGDRIAIATGTLTNTVDTQTGQAGVIASRGDLDIGAVSTFNLEGAQLYSAGNLAIGRTLDGNERATGVADQLQNHSARIAADGTMQLAANVIANRNNHFQTEQRTVSVTDVTEYQLDGHSKRWDASEVRHGSCDPDNFDCLYMPDGTHGQNYTKFRFTRTVSQTFITESQPGEILAGGNLTIAGHLLNDNSRIVVGGDLTGAPDTVTNNQAQGIAITTDAGTAEHTYTKWHGGFSQRRSREWDHAVAYQPAAVHRDSPMQIAADAALSPGAGNGVAPASLPARDPDAPHPDAGGVLPDLVLPDNPLFVLHPEPAHTYLIETDPQFTDYAIYLSSDYMLGRLAVDPQRAQKRLGDGFYEQQLVNDQIAALTGRRFSGGTTSNEGQYQALMDAGIASAASFHLTPGVGLTAEQRAALTADIVWLVAKDLTLPDGSITRVLAPVVYLAHDGADAANGQTGSAVISANNIDLRINGGLDNSGALQAAGNMTIHAGDIINTGVIDSGGSDANTGSTLLTATNDVINRGGTISGHQVGILAGRDVIMDTTTTSGAASTGDTDHGSSSSHTLINRVAGIEAGELDLRAGRDVNLNAAQIAVTGDATIAAGRDVKLNAVATETSLDLNADQGNHLRQRQSQANGTQMHADGTIAMVAGRDLQATAAYVNAGQGLSAMAGCDIRLDSAQQDSRYDQEITTSSSGFLASSTQHSRDIAQNSQAVGTTFSGDSVQIAAGHDIHLVGSNIVGTQDVALVAGNDIHLATSQDSASQRYFKEETVSGLFGADGGIGVTMGTKEQQHTQTTEQNVHNQSLIGSTDGNVQLVAGNHYTQSGSNVTALTGDIGIAAKSVDIEAVHDTAVQTTKDHTEQSGLTLSVSAPIISAVQTVQQMQSASSKTDDPRMKALAAATAASAASGAATAAENPTEGVTISLTVGSSKSDSQSTQTSRTAIGSRINAGGNIVIAAVGDGQNSHLNVIGSEIDAGHNAALQADGDINLRAAQSSSDQQSRSSSSSAAVGVAATYGSDGFAFGITANAAGSRGKADGSDLTNTNTHVTAGNNLTLESGHDTTLAGAVASGKQVTAHVGTSGQGDLTIQSLQDTSTYKSKDQNIGGSVTIGYGASGSFSAGQSKVDGDYASVGEQSGIKTGDGGFNVHVHGNTDLAGGVIAGTATADKNLLVTDTLIQSDIENHSRYDASSASIGGGYGKETEAKGKVRSFEGGATGTAGGYSSTDGSASGTSRSGVGAGTIVISDDQAQQQLTGQTAAAAIDSIHRDIGDGTESAGSLVKDWDAQQLKDKVTAEAQITAAFGAAASKEIGTYASRKQAEAIASGDKEEAAKWAEGGAYRVALHTGIGALTGGVEGAAGAFVSAKSMQVIADAMDQMDLPKGIKQGLEQVVATAMGAAVGGGAGAASGVNVEANNRQLHQSEYDLAKKHAKLVAKKLGISEQEAEGRIAAEIQRNSDQQTASATGGKNDYEIRSIIGCQNLNCYGYKNDSQYANHDANSQLIAPNQAAYDKGQAQLDQGQTYNDLVVNNMKKDPVGTTIAGTGMIGLGVITGGGLPAAGMASIGAGIDITTNGLAQLVAGDSFDWISFGMAGITGAASSGMRAIPVILTNIGGAFASSSMQGQNPNGAIAGAAIGTAIGFPIGAKIERATNNIYNPWHRLEWENIGMGVSTWVPKHPLPSWFGGIGSGTIGEITDGVVQKFPEVKK
jgi:filamentous hemagglutinin